jgi:heme exporter protein B
VSEFLRTTIAIYAKDLRLEARTRESIVAVLVFALLSAFIFQFAFDPNPRVVATVGPGIVWVAYLFAGILGLGRTFVLERDGGTLDGLVLAPVSREAIYAGKVLGAFTLMAVVEALMLPVFVVLYDLPVINPWFASMTLLATLGFAAVGTIFSAIAVQTRAREVLLPLLFLPVVLPVVVAAVASSSSIFQGEGWSDFGRWFQLLLVFDTLFLVISSLAFEYVLED